ncbi:hypothetical protein, partial [Pseudomonas syringae]
RRVASWGLAPEKNLEHSIKLQLSAGNVGFMGRLPVIRIQRSIYLSPNALLKSERTLKEAINREIFA